LAVGGVWIAASPFYIEVDAERWQPLLRDSNERFVLAFDNRRGAVTLNLTVPDAVRH